MPTAAGPAHRGAKRGRRRRRRGRRGVRRGPRPGRVALALAGLWLVAVLLVPPLVPPPAAVGLAGPPRPAESLRYLRDDSWIDADGRRALDQQIFDAALALIGGAERLVLVDMFLFNDWQGPEPETHRALADELAAALAARLAERPGLVAVLVTDPINTVYGGLVSRRLAALADAGVSVVLTDLTPLQDSNRLWSSLWRAFVRPFGNAPGGALPNPLGPGTVSLRSYLALANFKANHRKLLVADGADGALRALVTSANPHDASSAHRNTALAFGGAAAHDLLGAELALLRQSGAVDVAERLAAAAPTAPRAAGLARGTDGEAPPDAGGGGGEGGGGAPEASVQVLGERQIERAALALVGGAGDGDRVDLSMFYLADRDVVRALKAARARGARVRVLLDVNRDAFGRAKNGVPNRPVAAELVGAGIEVRWCETAGEQCHAKQLYVERATTGRAGLLLGSGNFTRRNLHDLNLETDVRVELGADHPLAASVREHFDELWNNTPERTYSSPYETHADESPWLRLQYRLMEASGLSTF